MKTEIWKDIPDYEGYYQVSDLGRVKSVLRKVPFRSSFTTVKQKILSDNLNTRGYRSARLSKNGITKTYKIATLVAIAFLNHRPFGYSVVVDHINEIKTDDRLVNLQLISQRKNASKHYEKKITSSRMTGVSYYKRTNKWAANINVNGKTVFIGYYENELEASNAYQNKLMQLC